MTEIIDTNRALQRPMPLQRCLCCVPGPRRRQVWLEDLLLSYGMMPRFSDSLADLLQILEQGHSSDYGMLILSWQEVLTGRSKTALKRVLCSEKWRALSVLLLWQEDAPDSRWRPQETMFCSWQSLPAWLRQQWPPLYIRLVDSSSPAVLDAAMVCGRLWSPQVADKQQPVALWIVHQHSLLADCRRQLDALPFVLEQDTAEPSLRPWLVWATDKLPQKPSGQDVCLLLEGPSSLLQEQMQRLLNCWQNQRLQCMGHLEIGHLLHAIPAGFCSIDSDEKVAFLNRQGRFFLPQLLPDLRAHVDIGTAFKTRSQQFFSLTAKGTDGVERNLDGIWHTEPLMQRAVIAFYDVSERKKNEDQLRWQASHDPLTRLYNRSYFDQALDNEMQRLRRSNECSALLYLDLDRFKYINDNHGHHVGDELLRELGAQLLQRRRSSDILARLGGDEFACILHNVRRDSLLDVADTYRKILEDFVFVFDNKRFPVNGSVGVSLFDRESASAQTVLVQADIACRIAKRKGRNQSHLYDQQQDQEGAEAPGGVLNIWSQSLEDALSQDLFRLYFQPLIRSAELALFQNCDDVPKKHHFLFDRGRPEGVLCEVLLRLVTKDGALMTPLSFGPSAERFNLFPTIDLWVLGQLLRDVHYSKLARRSTFFINISAGLLSDFDKVKKVAEMLASSPSAGKLFVFEFAENDALLNLYHTQRFIDTLKPLGCRFCLDDFGAGFCSFTQFRDLAVDFVKISGRYIRQVVRDQADRSIVSAIHQVAHSIGCCTVAKWVETEDEAIYCRQLGIDYIQGLYVSPPRASFDGHKKPI